MSSQFPLITTVKTAMPEVNPASFITAPESSSWLGRLVQPIKNHPILFTVTVLVVGIIGYVGYNIYKAVTNNASTASNGGDEDFRTNTSTPSNRDNEGRTTNTSKLKNPEPKTEKELYYKKMKEFADKRQSMKSEIINLKQEQSEICEKINLNQKLNLNCEYFYKTFSNNEITIVKLELRLNKLSQDERSFQESNAHILAS